MPAVLAQDEDEVGKGTAPTRSTQPSPRHVAAALWIYTCLFWWCTLHTPRQAGGRGGRGGSCRWQHRPLCPPSPPAPPALVPFRAAARWAIPRAPNNVLCRATCRAMRRPALCRAPCPVPCSPMMTTLRPRFPSSAARAMPDGPAPTTTTSTAWDGSGRGRADAIVGCPWSPLRA